LNTLRVDAKIFVSAKKYLRKKKFPDTCGHGLSGDASNEIINLNELELREEGQKAFYLEGDRNFQLMQDSEEFQLKYEYRRPS